VALDLKPTLGVALRDSANAVWTSAEFDTILSHALEETNRVRPRVVKDVIALVEDQDTYVLTNVYTVFRVDLLDASSKVVMPLPAGSWEVWGDNMSPGQTLYVNPVYANSTYQLRVHGYGPYDYTTNTPPLQVQEAIIAVAVADALRRITAERARYEQYAANSPRSDVSVNELLGQINQAEQNAARLLGDIRLIRRPTYGRG